MIFTRKSLSQGCLALRAQAGFFLVGGIQPSQIENDLLQKGKILWRVVLTYGAGILAGNCSGASSGRDGDQAKRG
jgi:hypothetical protein